MELHEAAERVLLGESLFAIASSYRLGMLTEMGFEPEDAPDHLFRKETMRFMNQLCRHFGDRHPGDRRVGAALESWVRRVDEYDAFDVLLSHYEFESRERVLKRGQMLFPGPLTAHWGGAED